MPGKEARVYPAEYSTGLPPKAPGADTIAQRKFIKNPSERDQTPLNNAPIGSPYTPVQNVTPAREGATRKIYISDIPAPNMAAGAYPGECSTEPLLKTPAIDYNTPKQNTTPARRVGKDGLPPSIPRTLRDTRVELSPGDTSRRKRFRRQPSNTPAFLPETQRYIAEFIKTTISADDYKLIDFFDRLGLFSQYDTEFIDLELFQQIVMKHYMGIETPHIVHTNWNLLSKTFHSNEASDGHIDVIFKSLCTHIIANPDTSTKLNPDGSIRLLNKAIKRYKARLLAKVVETIHQLVNEDESITLEEAKQLISTLIDLSKAEKHPFLNGLLPQSTIDELELSDLHLHSKETTSDLLQEVTQQSASEGRARALTEKDYDAILNLYAFSKLRENSEFDKKSNSLIEYIHTSLASRISIKKQQRTAQMIHDHILNLSNLSVHHLVPINKKAIDWLIYIYSSYTSFCDKYTATDPDTSTDTQRTIVDVTSTFDTDNYQEITHSALYAALKKNQELILDTQEKLKNPKLTEYSRGFWISENADVHYKHVGEKFNEIEATFTELGSEFFGERMFSKGTTPPSDEKLQHSLTQLFSLFIEFSCLILSYIPENQDLIQLLNEKTNDAECRYEENIVRDIWSKFHHHYLNPLAKENKLGLLFFELKKNWPNYHLAPCLVEYLDSLQRYDLGKANGIKISETTPLEKKRKKEVLVSCERMSGLIVTLALTVLESAHFNLPTSIFVPTSKHISSSEEAPAARTPCLPNVYLHSRKIPLAEYSRKAQADLAQFKTEEAVWFVGMTISFLFGLIPGFIVLGCYIHRKKVLEGRAEETNRLEQEREGRTPHTSQELKRQFRAPSKWSKSPNLFHCGNRTRSRSNRRVRKRNSGWAMNSHEDLDPHAKFSEVTVI